MEKVHTIHTPAELAVVGRDILAWHKVHGGSTLVIALQGDLGAGKTTFTQVLGKELGVAETITSPTFTIMKRYELVHPDFDQLVHIDAYRFETEAEAGPLRLAEVLLIPRTIVCLEWPERIPTFIPKEAVRVSITLGEGEARVVKMCFPA